MPDEIDFSEFLPKTPTPVAPLPNLAPTPAAQAPGGGIDFAEFLPTAPPSPGLAPAPRQTPNPVMPRTGSPVVNSDFDSILAKNPWVKSDPELVNAVYKQSEARTLDFAIRTGQYDKAKQIVNLGVDKDAARIALGSLLTGHPGTLTGIEEGGGLTRKELADLFAGVDSDSTGRTDAVLGQARSANPQNKTAGMAVYDILRQQQGMPSIDEANATAMSPENLVGENRNNIGSQFTSNLTANLALPGNMIGASALALGGRGNYFPEAATEVNKYRMPAPDGSAKGTAAALAGAIGGLAGDAPTMILGGTGGRVASRLGAGEQMSTAVSAGLGSTAHGMDTYGTTLNQGGSQIDALMRGAISVGAESASEGMFGVKGSMRLAMPGVSPVKPGMGEMLKDYAADAGSEVVSNQLDTNANSLYDAASTGKKIQPWEFQTVHDPKTAIDTMIAGLVGAPMAAGAHTMDRAANPPEPKYEYRFPMGMVHPDDARDFDASLAKDKAIIAAERAAMTPEERQAHDANEVASDNITEADMTVEVPNAIDALANNTPAPNDGGTQDYLHFFGKPDNSQQETRKDLAPDIQPDGQDKGVQGYEANGAAKTQVFTPEQLDNQKAQVVPANTERAANPKTAETKLDLAPVKDKALSDAETYIQSLPAEDQASAKDALVNWDHKADPLGYKGNIDNTLTLGKELAELRARKAKRLADAEAAKAPIVQAPSPSPTPAPAPTTAPPVRKQLERGAKKGPALVDQHLGKPGFKAEVPGNFVTRPVRLFTDAGQHPMHVQSKGVGGYHIAWDPARNKAVITAKTDTKGRKAEKGTELRPVDVNGDVQTIDSGKVTLYPSVEAAIKAAAPLTKAAEPSVNVAVKGRDVIAAAVPDDTTDQANPDNQTSPAAAPLRSVASDVPEVGDEVNQGSKKGAEVLAAEAELHGVEKELKALGARASSLSEDELNRTDELEAKVKDLKATISAKTAEAVATENSPLTPKMRLGLAKVLGADKINKMTPREVGEVVRKTLHLANDMQPTQAEIGRAIQDLEANGVLEKGQAIIPGDSVKAHAFNGGNLFSDPHEAKIVGLAQQALGITKAQVLENAISDIPFSQSAQVQEINAPKTTRLGHMTSTVIHHLTRALGMTGPIGAGIEQFVARLHLQNAADWVARLHPEFRPTLSAIREQMDQTKKERYEAYHRLDELKDLKGEERLHVRGALVSFRLEGVDGRKAVDFGNPVSYTDPKGRIHVYTLTPKELDVVKAVYAANRKLLQDQVDTMLSILGLPSNLKVKDLSIGLANGSIKPSARLVEPALRAIEEGSESYVPLMRTGNRVIRVYDQTKLNKAKNSKERKDAQLQTSNASTLQQERKIIDAAIHRFPTAHITVDHGDAMDSTTGITGISEKDLLDLAEASGISYGVLQQFMAGGISDYFATRGTKARFVAANRLEGFNHDMYQANVAHAMQMTNSTMALKYGKMVEDSITQKAIPDDRLRLYASRFADSMAAPASPIAGSVKSAITYWYLANNLASAAINGTASFIKGVMLPMLLSTSPVPGAKAFLEGSKQMALASLAILGRGHLGKWSGKSQVQLAIDGWKGVSPGLSKALEDADHAGHLQGKYDIDAEEIARHGEPSDWGKAKKAAFALGLHAFSSIEKANRIAASVVGYKLWESSMALKGTRKDAFIRMAHELNMDTSSAAKFMVDYSNSINFRNDKTESPSIARGVFDVNNKFHNLAPAQIMYSMHNYAMNETVSQVSYARAAWKAGWIPRATYAALLASAVMAFGSMHTIVGAPLASKAYQSLTGHLETLEQEGKDQGGIRRVLTTGGAGTAADALLGKRYGDYVDQIVKRANNANAIPDSLDPSSNIAAVGMVKSIVNAVGDIRSEVPERKVRGYAALAGKGVAHAVEYAQAAAEGSGKMTSTGSTAVAGPDKAAKGSPVLGALDYAAGMLGLTPPVVGDAYDRVKLIDSMKKSNDHELDVVVNGLASSFDIKDQAASREASGKFLDRLAAWNKKAVELDRLDMYITDGMLKLALMAELSNRANGAFDLKKVPKAGRIEALRQQAAQVSQDNIKE